MQKHMTKYLAEKARQLRQRAWAARSALRKALVEYEKDKNITKSTNLSGAQVKAYHVWRKYAEQEGLDFPEKMFDASPRRMLDKLDELTEGWGIR